jgi:hypothetical protein
MEQTTTRREAEMALLDEVLAQAEEELSDSG